MIKVEIGADAVRSFTSKAGKSFRMCEAYAFTLDPQGKQHPHPSRCEFFLNDSDPVPAPGLYLLAPASIYVDRSGRLSIAPKLVPAAK